MLEKPFLLPHDKGNFTWLSCLICKIPKSETRELDIEVSTGEKWFLDWSKVGEKIRQERKTQLTLFKHLLSTYYVPCTIPNRKFNSEQDSLTLGTQSSRVYYTLHNMSYNRNAKGHRCPQRATLTLFGESQNCHLDLVLMGKESLPNKEKEGYVFQAEETNHWIIR